MPPAIDTGAVRVLRVLHLVDSLGLGGTQAVLKTYMESRRDDQVFLYCLRRTAGSVVIAHPNVAIADSSSRFSIAPLLALRRLVVENRIDVVHCHLFRAQVFGLALKLLHGHVALVFHEHGRAVGREGESRIEAAAFRAFIRLAASHVDRFVCISEAARSALLGLAPNASNRIVVVNNPIRQPVTGEVEERDELRRGLGVPEGTFVFGFAARLVKTKGWREFIDAIGLVRDAAPVSFLIAGDGPNRQAVATRVQERGLQDHGRLLGQIADMNRFYRALDCFVSPSHWETHGLSHLEAQSHGLPVIVSNVPGMNGTVHPEVDALLCPARDAGKLAEAMLRIVRDPGLRAALSKKGMDNAACYTVDRFAENLDAVHASALSSKRDGFRHARAGTSRETASKRSGC